MPYSDDDEEETPLEINDYSQATEFERCVGRLEALLRKWQRGEEVDSNGGGEGYIECGGIEYHIRYKRKSICGDKKSDHGVTIMEDLMSSNFDFAEPLTAEAVDEAIIPLHFGVQEFIQINPLKSSTTSHTEILSAATLAASSLQIPIPVLVSSRKGHSGLANTRNCTVRFSTETVRSPPEHCSTLEGILDTFYLNIGLRTSLEGEGMHVVTRFRYAQSGYRLSEWCNVMSPEHSPFMSDTDPIRKIFIDLIWPDTIETGLIDNRVWSTFNLQDPPMVKMKLLQKERCDKTYKITESIRALVDILSDLECTDSDSDEGRPYISKGRRSVAFHPPWIYNKSAGESFVGNLAGFDPDSRGTLERETKVKCQNIVDKAFSSQPLTDKSSVDSASVLERLAFLAVGSLSTEVEYRILQKLFLQKISEYWESLTEIPGVGVDGKIDWGVPLLTQKVQLLNYCIVAATQADGYHTPDDEEQSKYHIPQNLQLRTNGCRDEENSYEITSSKLHLPADVITSDMMSFKHANASVNSEEAFDYFIKWWSPHHENLSSHPQIQNLWEAAVPAASCNQLNLNDFTGRATNVLGWIENMELDMWVHSLVHHAIIAGAKIMKGSVFGNRVTFISGEIDNFMKDFHLKCSTGYVSERPKLNYDDICQEFEGLEELLCLAASLLDRYHLPVTKPEESVKVIHVVNRLLASQSSLMISPSDWEVISLATLPAPDGAPNSTRDPDSREFIVRCIGDRPAVAPTALGMYQNKDPTIEPCTHRMYVSIKEGEFRLCTTLSENLH